MRPTFRHVDLVVSSLERSLPFYREFLRPLGLVKENEIRGERGERVVYIAGVRGEGRPPLGLREALSTSTAPYDRYAIGLHHLAFEAPSRAAVDSCADWLMSIDATIESGPEEYPYGPGYYALFFYDPDGIKLELVHRPDLPVRG